jgi:hypothetical protein
MAKFSTAVRNAQLDAIEATIGTAAKLYVRTGAAPSATADADSGTLLVEIDLPSDWLANASGGTKDQAGSWSGTAVADGAVGHFRIKDSTGTTTHIQGTAGTSGELTTSSASFSNGQTVTISSSSFTAGNA